MHRQCENSHVFQAVRYGLGQVLLTHATRAMDQDLHDATQTIAGVGWYPYILLPNCIMGGQKRLGYVADSRMCHLTVIPLGGAAKNWNRATHIRLRPT